MILVEKNARNPELLEFVDRYQLFVISEAAYLKTVPNGKIECYLVEDGGFERFDAETNSFASSNKSGFLPASNETTIYQIPERLVCINIKLNLDTLSLATFEGFLSSWKTMPVNTLISDADQHLILESIDKRKPTFDVDLIDDILAKHFSLAERNIEINKLLHFIDQELNSEFKVTMLADHMNMSTKTLERLTRKYFMLSPKELWNVVRFENTTSYLKNTRSSKLIEALSFGYYDQSHFIKECKKVTGYTPKEFFSKLKLSTNDLIIEK